MRISVVGTGYMGTGLGKQFAKHGHDVLFSYSRSLEKLRSAATDAGNGATVGTPAEAVAFGEVILLSVGWGAVREALHALGSLKNKVLLSCVNPLTRDYRGLVIGTTTSAAEEISRLSPESRVVEGFLNVFAGILHSDSVLFGSDRPSVFFCGDDEAAKVSIGSLIESIGFEPVDSGPLRNARLIEPTAALLLQLGAFQGLAKEWKPGEYTDLAVKLLRR